MFTEKPYYIIDGGLGTMLQQHGLEAGACPELMNIEQKDAVLRVHRAYVEAGADVLSTNTFGGNRLKLEEYGLGERTREINRAAVEIAREAAGGTAFVAGSIGPTGYFLQPLGEMDFDTAYQVFREQAEALAEGGADCLLFETFNDLGELRAGVIAAREATDLPILVSLTYENGKTLTGVDPACAAVVLEALGVFAIGANCSGGPKELFPVLARYKEVTNLPLFVQPNAGMPELREGKTCFPLLAEAFMEEMRPYFSLGLRFFGSCCGSNPTHTRAYGEALAKYYVPGGEKSQVPEGRKTLASKSRLVTLGAGELPRLIGERINPTARKKLAESLRAGDLSVIQEEAYLQTEKGAHLLDINLGIPGIAHKEVMKDVVCLLQQGVDTPLVIDSTTPEVIEEALRYYQGKALVNSVNGEEESMAAILPLVKRYGAGVIALTLDEAGIPAGREGRLAIARRIVERAEALGISRKDIYVDCLVMTMGTDDHAARETLETVRLIRETLGVSVVLGVSNVSHGLPERSKINGAFLAIAIFNGLDLGIVNPENQDIMNAWEAGALLAGRDPHAAHYLSRNTGQGAEVREEGATVDVPESVAGLVLRGSRNIVQAIARLLEMGYTPLDIINRGLIAGLNQVGEKFEKGEYYLPQLMLSAEVSQMAFTYIEKHMEESGAALESRGCVVIGTVKGDVHDIGKNMAAVMIKNHGYQVVDLGKNVSYESFLEAVRKYRPDFVGLSALMTTTMTEIPETIAYVRQEFPEQRFLCGGAVITPEFARASGAEGYCRDAVHTIAVMEELQKTQGK